MHVLQTAKMDTHRVDDDLFDVLTNILFGAGPPALTKVSVERNIGAERGKVLLSLQPSPTPEDAPQEPVEIRLLFPDVVPQLRVRQLEGVSVRENLGASRPEPSS